MNQRQLTRLIVLLTTVAAPLAALRSFDDQGCYTMAKVIGGVYFIDCPAGAQCGGQGLCDKTYNQIGSTYYHFCACDDLGEHPTCQGIMVSNDPDPDKGGYDVRCFEGGTCPANEYCDEAQIGSTFQKLCVCKRI